MAHNIRWSRSHGYTTVQNNLIPKLTDLLEARYIFLDKAQQMSAYLRQHSADYEAIADAEKLAHKLTDDLRRISSDKHLHVVYDPATVAELLVTPDKDEMSPRALKYYEQVNYGFQRVEWFPGGIGYLDFRMFAPPGIAGEVAVAAMNFLANAKAIIFDLRQNGGGDPQMVQLLTSYLFDPKIQHLNSFYTRHSDEYTHFWTLPYVPGKRATKADVYVLTSSRTFSGAEEFTYNLKVMKRATIVGETTGGGAHPGEMVALNDQLAVFLPTGRAINPTTQTNWEGTGVTPDIETTAADALRVAHRQALQKLLLGATDDDERTLFTRELANLEND